MAEPFRIPSSFAEKVDQLVRDFEQSEDFFLSDSYPEHQARIDFIDPLFEALGWAIALRPGENPHERDVIVERGPTIGRPDYNFRISGQTKFYVEAKAPSVALSRSDAILQAKKYAWNNTDQYVYFVVVTDFQEIRFYDASRKPDPRHPDAGLIFKHGYRSYLRPQVARDIWQLSREAVQSGSLDKLLSPAARSARQKTPLDILFLGDLSSWREQLAKAVFKVHPNFSPADLNSAVQVLLDRLIFIRIAEDRGALPPNRLRDIARTWRDERTQHPISADLFPLFREVNEDLNGEIFKPHLCEQVTWDSSLIAEIILSGLEPYNFAQIGVELLGSIYERYLGKAIRVTAKRAIVEDKPEVRKAGGVYYTPSYVVKYIVANTLGALITGKSPAQIARLRILDPACGSGSFLLAAYQMLLDHHLEWYKHHPKQVPDDAQLALFKEDGDWRLSLREKARILTNNIYGVDIDPQAVEIAMMSLYIRLLEGEKGLPHKKRLLPALASNIKCGNSLIPPQLVHKHLFPSDDPVTRATPFDWSSKREGFGEILAEGGFHVVIGNPPYVRPHNIPLEIKKMLWALYSTFVAKSDEYSCFMERALTLTRPNGLFSFIVPHTWTSLESFTKTRSFIIRNAKVLKLVQLPKKVFTQATVETCIFVFQRTKGEPSSPDHLIHVEKLEPPGEVTPIRTFPQGHIQTAHLFNFQLHGRDQSQVILARMNERTAPLAQFVQFLYGFKTADDEKFVHATHKHKESKPFIRSAGVHRYWHDEPGEYVWYVPGLMVRNKRTARPGEPRRFESEKIIVSRMGKQLIASYDPGGLYVKDAMLLLPGSRVSLKYLLALINSRLMNYYYQEFFVTIDVLKNALLALPIRVLDLAKTADMSQHDRMVDLVDQMLALQRARQQSTSPTEAARIEGRIKLIDEKIDESVYKLYGLTTAQATTIEAQFDQ